MERSISSRLNSRRSPSPRGGGPLGSRKRKEIDNVMRKARAFPNETWDKKLLEAEEKDPNRWRHTGFKKMYIEEDPSSSDSDRGPGGGGGGGGHGGRFGNGGRRSRSRSPRSPLPPPPRHRRSPSPPPMRKRRVPVSPSPPPPPMRRRPPSRSPSPLDVPLKRRPRSPPPRMRRPSPPPEYHRKSSPPPRMGSPPPHRRGGEPPLRRMSPLPPRVRGKRPPSPPPKMPRSVSASSGSEDSCSGCSMDERHHPRSRPAARWPQQQGWTGPPKIASDRDVGGGPLADQHADRSGKEAKDPRRKEPMPKVHRVDKDPRDRPSRPIPPPPPPERVRHPQTPESDKLPSPKPRVAKHKPIPEDPRPVKARQPKPPPPEAAPAPAPSKKHKEKTVEKQLRARVKIEGEPKQRRPRSPSSGSEDSSSSESSLPRFTATTRLTLSERFGKMAQWSVDRSNMENMRITKNSSGGDLKVMIEEEMEAAQPPPARYAYSPAPAGHFPEELMTTGPSGLSSWDDVRVRYEYYKGRGYLRDLDLEDYVKWEEWWYKYQEWLKQERYYEMWERSQLNRRRKKVPIAQRLN